MAADPSGLRARKKEQTRIALSWATIRLAVDRGLANVRVEDIAAEVGVSPRTFNNYFASKGEAIADRELERFRQFADALRGRPADEPLWPAITAAVRERYALTGEAGADEEADETARQRWVEGVRLMIAEPAVQRDLAAASAAAEQQLAAAVAARTGTDPDRDMFPRLVAGTVGVVLGTARQQWLRDQSVPIADLIADALAQVANGLGSP
ncbi:TetR family transcriptional regulator [Actinocatenispora sera]|uniref:TetR family transcriptional regulator n=1 Tax=Actinocatenispora sera TaxID=390989 RepID=A0A810L5R4_9ACTN|nr:TetR family transcriptional regulator [Actinocatenispora sera]BCJ29962.1 TetR family transcriptional regulator [Actinocatenispora sera]